MSIQVTIGTAPCSWGVWWPDGTPSRTPYNVFLDQAAQAGYKTLELGPVGYLPTDVEQLRDELDMAEAHKEKCQARMLEICEREFPEELKRLQTIPGIKERAATSLIAEIGTDMNKFETANHLASWSGLKPRNDESNKKIKSRSITHGNVYLRKTIIECAWAASRTKDCFFSRFSYHQTQVRKKNKMKVLVAVARKMLIAVWHVLHDNTNYIDFTTDRKTSPTRG